MLLSKSFSEGCTFFDVVLQCYLSLNLMPKFILDNNITDLNLATTAGQSFVYDSDFVEDEFLNFEVLKNDYKFCTGRPIFDTTAVRGNYLLTEMPEILANEQENIRIT